MTTTTDALERRLEADLSTIADRLLHDDKLAADLYGALTGFSVAPNGEPEHLALSWRRAAELIDAARVAAGGPPLYLFQSGREGDVSDRATETLERLGWELRPRRTDAFDPDHVSDPERPPRQSHEPPDWKRVGDEEAELERHRERTGETRRELHERHE
jgi:hypothetical protein